jgi:hypothetical protein
MKPLPKVAAPTTKRRPKATVAAKNGVLPVLALPDRVAPAILERISRGGEAKAGSEFTQTRAISGTIGGDALRFLLELPADPAIVRLSCF